MNGTALIRGLAASAATALTTLAIPAVAGAADYCVGQNLGCDGPHTVQSLDAALSSAAADADADRILLGAGLHMPSNGFGFSYPRGDAPVEIVGQGAGETIITRPNGASGWVLRLEGGAGTSVHDVTIRIPENASGNARGLATSNLAHDITIDEHPSQVQQRFGAELYKGGRLEDATVTLDGTEDTMAVRLLEGGATVRSSTLSGRIGVYSYFGGTVERSRVTGSTVGVYGYRGTTTIASSLIRFGDSGDGTGIVARALLGEGSTVNANGVTIVGPGLPYTYGVSAGNSNSPAQSAHVDLTNSIIRGASNALYAFTPVGASGHASVAARYSDYDPSGNTTKENASISESNVSNVGDPGFADAAAGDYRLLPGSPLIDAGDPATAQALDLDGNPLVTDGNHDGTARRDLGAIELPGPLPAQNPGGGEPSGGPSLDSTAPAISRFRATRTRRGASLRYTLSESARVTLKIQRAIRGSKTRYRTIGTLTRSGVSGANSTSVRGRLAKRVRIPGRYRVRITAADMAGNRAAPKTARFRVPAA